MKKSLLTLSATALLLMGCAATTIPSATASPSPSPSPTVEPVAVATATPAPTVTWSAPPVLTLPLETPTPAESAAPTPSATATAPAAIAPAAAVEAQPKQEDDEGWDCYADGDLICGPTDPTQQAEAWENFDTAGFTEDELARPFKVTYRGTVKQESILADGHEWYLAPSSTAGLDHAFEIEFGVTK